MSDSPCNVNASTCDNNSDIYVNDVITTPGLCAALTYFCMVFLLSLLCNGTICVVFYKRPNLLTVSNSLVLNLTCCELGLSILIMPFWVISLVSRKWVMSDIWCRIQAYLLTMLMVALQYSLLIIAVDRNYAIINSLRYPYIFSPRLGNILIAITWVLGLAIGMPPLFTYGEFTYHRTQFVCAVTWESQSKYGVFIVFAAFILPFIVQTGCYMSIFKAAIKHTKSVNRIYPSVGSTSTAHDISIVTIDIDDVTSRASVPRSRKNECKAVKTLLIIYGSYMVSWTCYVTVGLMKAFGAKTSDTADMAGICLVFLSCAINPVIYGFMNRLTRNEIWKCFSRASQRITGRESVLIESDDYYSSTLTTNFSSGRHTSGSFIPVSRGRSNSIKVGCTRAADMMTIQEVSETDDENNKSNSTLNESSNVPIQSKIRKLDRTDAGGVILRPSNLRKKLMLKRWHSNDDIIRNVQGNVNGKVVPTHHRDNLRLGASGRTRTKILLRSQSVAGELAGTTLTNSRMKTLKLKGIRNPLSLGDIL